jgi:hypothetical protein
MSNGLTSVFLSVLLLNGSALAISDREKELVAWLAGHDQAIRGLGTVGFDLSEIPWSEDCDREKAFLIRVIDDAKSKRLWERLDYEPHFAVLGALDQFRRMIDVFRKEDLEPSACQQWSQSRPRQFLKCPEHGVYLTSWSEDGMFDECSCLLCNDRSVPSAMALATLPPEQQLLVRRQIEIYNQMLKERKDIVGLELVSLRRYTEEQRKERLASDKFKSKFTSAEQKMLEVLSDNFPLCAYFASR